MNSFSRSVDMLHRALDVTTLRYQVSANNLANSEVANFKRSEVNFESQLARALESEKAAASGESFVLRTTDPRHFQSSGVTDYTTVQPRRVTDWHSTSKANGNNVDAEEEAMLILKTQMNYQLLTAMENFQFNQIKLALK